MTGVLWQMIDHRFTKGHASEYLDGEISRFGRERIERHASVCPQCRALLASLRRVVEELPKLSRRSREGVAEGVLQRLRG